MTTGKSSPGNYVNFAEMKKRHRARGLDIVGLVDLSGPPVQRVAINNAQDVKRKPWKSNKALRGKEQVNLPCSSP